MNNCDIKDSPENTVQDSTTQSKVESSNKSEPIKDSSSRITNYPYLAKAQNLFDYFLIIGHELSDIQSECGYDIVNESIEKQDLIDKSEVINDCDTNEEFDKTKSLSVLNCISSVYCEQMIDENLIMSFIFPKTPPLRKMSSNKKVIVNYRTVTFFLNGDSVDGSNKNIFYGTALVFDEYFRNKNKEIIQIPKAFCIISQNPFFTLFNNILISVHKYFKEPSIKIPIEIILYNLINFIPNPLNNNYIFNCFHLNHQSASNEEQNGSSSNEIVNDNNSNTNVNVSVSLNETQVKKERTISKLKEINLHSDFYLYQISGYPFMDINMSEIFKIIPPQTIITIMILSFLEVDMLVFSEHLSQLNTFMYIISLLSYPCTDSTYFWHIISISLEDLKYEENNCKFVGKQTSVILGVNSSYDKKIDVTETFRYYIAVDIDNNDLEFKCRGDLVNDQNVQDILNICEYLKTLMENNETKENEKGFLASNVINLHKYLFNIYKSIPKDDKNIGIQNANFFEFDERIHKLNRSMQEAFYKFVLNILDVFHSDCSVKTNDNFDKQTKTPNENDSLSQNNNVIKTKHYIKYTPEFKRAETEIDKCFFNIVGETCKIRLFYNVFLIEHNTIDLYKLPFIFAENFILLRRLGLKDSTIKLFDIIDDFYLNYNDINFNSSDNNTSESFIQFDFANFIQRYNESFKQLFHEEIKLSSNVRAVKTHKIEYRYSRLELNNQIIYQYEHLLSNLNDDERNKIFPSLQHITSNKVKTSLFTKIYDSIEYSLINKVEFKYEDLIRFSLLIIISVISEFTDINDIMSLIMSQMELIKYSIRKYILIIFKIYNHLANKKINDMKIRDIAEAERLNYYLLSNFLSTKQILPDQELLEYMEKFAILEQKASQKNISSIPEEQPQETQKEVRSSGFFSRKEKKLEDSDSISCKLNFKKNIAYLENNALFDGDLYDNKKVKYIITYSIPKGKRKIDVPVYSPKKLYKECNFIVQQFLESDFDTDKIDKEKLINVLVVLRFYLKNLDEFKDVSCELFLKYLQTLLMQ